MPPLVVFHTPPPAAGDVDGVRVEFGSAARPVTRPLTGVAGGLAVDDRGRAHAVQVEMACAWLTVGVKVWVAGLPTEVLMMASMSLNWSVSTPP